MFLTFSKKLNIKLFLWGFDKMNAKEGIVLDSEDVESEKVEKGEKIWIKRLITDKEGADNCFMRKFTLKPNASMPHHDHEKTDHVQYVLSGEMEVNLGDKTKKAKQGDILYIPADLSHSYENPHDEKVEFLCIVPAGDIKTHIKE